MENRAIDDVFETLIRSAVVQKTEEELSEYEDAGLYTPYEETERYQNLIAKYKTIDNRKRTARNIYKAASLVLIVLIVSTSIGLVTVEAFRERVFGIIKIMSDDSITFVKEGNEYNYVEPTEFEKAFWHNLPKGFSLIEESATDNQSFYRYTNENDEFIILHLRAADTNMLTLLLQDGNVSKKIYNHYEIYYDQREMDSYALTYDEDYMYTIRSNLAIEQILPLIEKILK